MTKREILHLHNRFGFGLLHSQVEMVKKNKEEAIKMIVESYKQNTGYNKT